MRQSEFQFHPVMVPPAPSVRVNLAPPGETLGLSDQIALLDTGAYMSVLPQTTVAQLRLIQVRDLRVEGLDGVMVILPTYLVEITIPALSPIVIEVLGSQGERRILLGRDVLNRYRITLDGPAQSLTIEEP